MFGNMKCIKTGCDVLCEGMLFRGDLFFHEGILILTGVPYESYYSYKVTKDTKFHFVAKNIFRINSSNYQNFLIQGIESVNEEFLEFLKVWSKEDVFELFERANK